jgi:hypothetical protein
LIILIFSPLFEKGFLRATTSNMQTKPVMLKLLFTCNLAELFF